MVCAKDPNDGWECNVEEAHADGLVERASIENGGIEFYVGCDFSEHVVSSNEVLFSVLMVHSWHDVGATGEHRVVVNQIAGMSVRSGADEHSKVIEQTNGLGEPKEGHKEHAEYDYDFVWRHRAEHLGQR